ncbi:MAG: hypothetical protein KGR26_00535 [Cyanobacteria bacterium REEB65]|nr:hypothetical protein [Cyanobacteria bacterium REEB65]
MVPEDRLPATLMLAQALLGAAAAITAMLLGHLAVARGIAVGAGLGVVYLAVLWRYVGAFVAQARGQRIGMGGQILLRSGLLGRLLLAGAVLYWVAQHQSGIDLWAAIAAFLSYRVLLSAHQFRVILTGRREPLPPAIGWTSEDDTFTARERSTIGRTRRWRKSR